MQFPTLAGRWVYSCNTGTCDVPKMYVCSSAHITPITLWWTLRSMLVIYSLLESNTCYMEVCLHHDLCYIMMHQWIQVLTVIQTDDRYNNADIIIIMINMHMYYSSIQWESSTWRSSSSASRTCQYYTINILLFNVVRSPLTADTVPLNPPPSVDDDGGW